MGVVFDMVMEDIAFWMGFVTFSVVVGGGVVDRLGRLVDIIFGRTNMMLVVGATFFRSVRAP